MKKKIFTAVFAVFVGLLCMGSECDFGLKPKFTVVEGDVLFLGDWPDEAVMAFIVVVDEKPDELVLDLNLLSGFYQIPEFDIENEVDSIHFEIELNAGVYNWVFIAILDSAALNDPDNGMGWRNLAAEYLDSDDSTSLGSISIGEDEKIFIEMIVDFDNPYRWRDDFGDLQYFHLVE